MKNFSKHFIEACQLKTQVCNCKRKTQNNVLMGGKGGGFESVLEQRNPRAYSTALDQEHEHSGEAWTSSSAPFSPPSSVSILFKKESSDGICGSTKNTLRLVKQRSRKYKNSFCSSWYSLRVAKKYIRKTGGIIQGKTEKKKKACTRTFFNRREGATESLVVAVL